MPFASSSLSRRMGVLAAAGLAAASSALAPSGATAQNAPVDTVVDFHMTYTQEREDNYGGRNATLAIMRAAQGLMNRAHREGNTGVYVNYVLPTKVNYNADSSSNQGLNDLAFGRVPGVFDRRNRIGADGVGLNAAIRAAGVAFVGNPQFFVVRFLSGPAAAHEVGHTFGCGHGGIDGGAADQAGDRGYARGFAFRDDRDRRMGTIMTGAQIIRYSTPTLTFEGRPIGQANRMDNRRRIRETRRESSRVRNLNPLAVGGGQPWILTNRDSGLVLENRANRAARGNNIQLWPFREDAPHHTWDIVRAPTSGYFKLRNRGNGRLYVDVAGVSRATSANVHQWSDNGARGNQELKLRPAGDGTHRLIFRHSDLALTATGSNPRANVVQRIDRGGPRESWWFRSPY